MTQYILFAILLISSLNLSAQNRVDIRFNPSELGSIKSCFDVELKSLENTKFSLAGQNYRIYFDPNNVSLIKDKLKSYGDKKIYSSLKSQRKHHSDEIDITMINLAVDALEYNKTQTIELIPQQWIKTSNVCFSHKENAKIELTWARPKETSDLATAYVTLSQWDNEKKQSPILINEYYDFDNGQIADENLFQADINIYPNPVVDLVNLKIGPFGEMEHGKLIIVDASGKMYKKLNIDKGVYTYQVDMKSAPEGSYYLEIVNEREENVFQSAFVKSSL